MIRPGRPVDAAALARLQSHLPRPSPRLLEAALDSPADGPSPVVALVSTAGDVPVGYLLAAPGDGTTYVAELVVAPAHRREGRARALLTRAARDADRLTVTVDPGNQAALSLYRDCGFERVRRLPDFFDGDPAVLLERER